jgi:hypothetical protein
MRCMKSELFKLKPRSKEADMYRTFRNDSHNFTCSKFVMLWTSDVHESLWNILYLLETLLTWNAKVTEALPPEFLRILHCWYFYSRRYVQTTMLIVLYARVVSNMTKPLMTPKDYDEHQMILWKVVGVLAGFIYVKVSLLNAALLHQTMKSTAVQNSCSLISFLQTMHRLLSIRP